MSAGEPLMLVFDADLPDWEKRNYEVRGARFLASAMLSDELRSTPSTVVTIWYPLEGFPAIKRAEIKQFAEGRGITTRSSNGLVGLRDLLKALPAYSTSNSNSEKPVRKPTPIGPRFTVIPKEEPIVSREELLSLEITRLEGLLANALEAKERLEVAFDRLERKQSQTGGIVEIERLKNENQRLIEANQRLETEFQSEASPLVRFGTQKRKSLRRMARKLGSLQAQVLQFVAELQELAPDKNK